jgi:hypothetical protein
VSVMVDEQLDLLADAPHQRPLERARAALLNARPTPVHAEDPLTAWEASVAAALRAPSVRQRVLFALVDCGEHGATDWELSEELHILRTTAGKRRVELQRLGLCKRTEQRRLTGTASTAVVHRITEEGQAVAQQITEARAE